MRAPVDLDAAHGVGLDEDHVAQRAERLGVVAGALRRELDAALGGVRHEHLHVGRVDRERDQHRLLLERQVVGLAGGVPTGVARLDERAAELVAQVVGVDRAGERGHRETPVGAGGGRGVRPGVRSRSTSFAVAPERAVSTENWRQRVGRTAPAASGFSRTQAGRPVWAPCCGGGGRWEGGSVSESGEPEERAAIESREDPASAARGRAGRGASQGVLDALTVEEERCLGVDRGGHDVLLGWWRSAGRLHRRSIAPQPVIPVYGALVSRRWRADGPPEPRRFG